MTLDYSSANRALVRAIDRQPNSHHLFVVVMDSLAPGNNVLQVALSGCPDSWAVRYDELARDTLAMVSTGTYRANGQPVRVAFTYPADDRLVAVAAAGAQVDDLEAFAQRVLGELKL